MNWLNAIQKEYSMVCLKLIAKSLEYIITYDVIEIGINQEALKLFSC